MKYLKQFFIILAVSFLGELLNYLLPFPIPGSVYGIALLYLALRSGIIPLDAVKETGRFLIGLMPVIFIAPSAGIVAAWDIFRPIWLPVALISVVSTAAVMGAGGKIAQFLARNRREMTK